MMNFISEINLRNPWWLLLALQPWLMWLLAAARQRMQQDSFADTVLLPWVLSQRTLRGSRQLLRQLALVLAWGTFAVAMSGPRLLQRIIDHGEANYLTLQVVVDASYSMSARDVVPTRMQRIKLELHDLLDRLHQVRMGIIVYAARAHVMIPPTSDKSVLRHAVDLLRVRELPTEGSDLLNALQLARQHLQSTSNAPRAILLISDGEVRDDSDQAQQQLTGMVTALRQDNIHLYTLGVGTAQGAPLLDDQNGWLQQAGHTVVTHLHASRLQQLAQQGNGAYAEVADDDSDWRSLYDEGIAQLQVVPRNAESTQQVIWQDLSPWFVLPGVLLLLFAYVQLPMARDKAAMWLVLSVAMVIGLLQAPPAQAADDTYATAFTLYQAGKYQEAAREFAQLPGFAARMAEGASEYHLRHYAQAATVYIQAVLDADSDTQRAAALFNLGNSYFQQQAYAQAAAAYRDVLRYQTDFAAAKTNLTFAVSLQEKAIAEGTALVQRAGTGANSATAAPNTVVGKGRVGIDESESKTPEQHTQELNTASQPGVSNKLLQQARPATEKIELNKDVQWTYDIVRAQNIAQPDVQFSVDESTIWQRLYESEEDYPAPRERPEVVPGETPW